MTLTADSGDSLFEFEIFVKVYVCFSDQKKIAKLYFLLCTVILPFVYRMVTSFLPGKISIVFEVNFK